MVKGKILKLKTGLIVVPYEYEKLGCNCVVVKGNENYPVGDYNIFVFDDQLEEAEQIKIS